MKFIRGAYIKSGLITIMKDLKLKYYTSAEDSIEGWEKYSFPIGNGYAGASIFDGEYNEKNKALLTYKVVAVTSGKHDSAMSGAVAVVNPATELEKERYKLKFRMNNINLE